MILKSLFNKTIKFNGKICMTGNDSFQMTLTLQSRVMRN